MTDVRQKTEGQQYIESAGKTHEVLELKKLLNRCAADLDRANAFIEQLQAEDTAEEKREERRRKDELRAEAQLRSARAAAIRALVKLLPEAVRQARAKPPRPALLRMILRATR